MKRLILPIVVASCVVAASVLAGPVKQKPAPKKQKPKEEWYKILVGGKPAGYLHSTEKFQQYEGREIRHEVMEGHLYIPVPGGVVKTTMLHDVRQELDGRLIKQSVAIESQNPLGPGRLPNAPMKMQMEVTVKNGVLKASKTKVQGEGKEEKEIKLAKGTKVYAGIGGSLLKRHGIGPGDVAEFNVFSFMTMRLKKQTVKKVERIKHVHNGKKVDAFRVIYTSSDRPNVKMTAIMSTDYDLLKLMVDNMECVLSNKKEALANLPPPQNEILDE